MKFFLTCLFIALYLIRPFEFLPLMYGSPILLIVGCLGLLSVFFSTSSVRTKWCEADTFMLFFFVAILFSHVSHFYLGGVIASFEQFLPVFLAYFLISYSVTTRRQVVIVLCVIVVCTCFIAVEGCLEYNRGISFFGIEPFWQKSYSAEGELLTEEARIKWLGTFSDPNDLALLFVVPIPFLLARFRQNKVISLAAGVLLLFGIFYTNSRGGMLSLLVAIFVYFVLRYRNRTGLMLGVVFGICILVLGPSRVGEISAEGGSAYGRIEAWYQGFQMFMLCPFFGVGMGMFTDFNELTAHNSFVLVMAELGMFGAFWFVGLFLIPLKKLLFFIWGEDRSNLSTEDLALLAALAASLCGVMMAMFFLSRSYILIPYMLIALIARCLAYYDPAWPRAFSSGKTLKEVLLCTVLCIGLIYIFIKVLL